MGMPSRSTRNFSKFLSQDRRALGDNEIPGRSRATQRFRCNQVFRKTATGHFTFPGNASLSFCQTGDVCLPFTSIFSNSTPGKPYLPTATLRIFSADPGSWCLNWLHGNARMEKSCGRPMDRSSAASSSYVRFVRPHLLATLMSKVTLPRNWARSIVDPSLPVAVSE